MYRKVEPRDEQFADYIAEFITKHPGRCVYN
jgi:hypothetical protein